ncbi:MAG TPA: hypothetical protein VK452_02125 [Dissulfurispiraceae bacterium]|nr:hypothetical protein [Dissulfurispiraceae bacterium]
MFSKYIPWLVTVIALGLLAFIWQDIRTQLSKKDVELTNLKAQYDKMSADASAKMQALAAQANQKIQLANLPEVKVKVSFRKAFFSSGDVAQINNISNQSIAINADVERPAAGQKKTFTLTTDPGRVKEIGEREGWAFVSGDVVTISQPEHKALIFKAP